MTTLKVGIASYEQMKARTLAIARGKQRARRYDPKSGSRRWRALRKFSQTATAPFWPSSRKSNLPRWPNFQSSPARAKSNLSRTLKTMERYGFVQLCQGQGRKIVPGVLYSAIALAVPIGFAQQDSVFR